MSFQIDAAFVQQFSDTIHTLAQQADSKFRGAVRERQVVGKYFHFERIGPTDMVKLTSRHADTPLISTPHSRRRVVLEDYAWADLIDSVDEVKLLISPASEYAQNAARALNRRFDDSVIAAFGGNSISVNADDSTALIALPASQKIADGGTGMTLAKLLQAKKILDAADVEESGRHIVISPDALEDLLNVQQVTSADYNTIKALVNGEINTYLGFTWHKSTRLPKSGNIRSCYAWHEAGIGVAIGKEIRPRIDVLPGKNYATQVYICMTIGATRVEEARVVQIDIVE